MTLRMADGPVENLPAGLDAYAGYSDDSGIGVTWPEVQEIPAKYHLSISVHGQAPAMCGDVENGALSSWVGYDYGYCAVSNANAMIAQFGRPKKLWLAHYDPSIGSHICSPACWPGLVTTADGTQWTDHNNVWDESLLSDDFFGTPAPTPPPPDKEMSMILDPILTLPNGTDVVVQVGQENPPLVYGKGRPADKEWNENSNKELCPILPGTVPVQRLSGGQVQVFCEQASDAHVVVFATNDGVTWGQLEMG